MKKIIFLLSVMILFIVACDNDEDENTINTGFTTGSEVTYAGEVDGVSVLVFGLFNSNYVYQKTITGTWVNKRISSNLELGDYKFLYYKAPQSYIVPTSLTGSKFEQIRFNSQADPVKGGNYIKPVEEVWLPETTEMANEVYTIVGDGEDLIQNTLQRAYTQIELNIRRGKFEDNEYTAIPFEEEDDNIMKNIAEIHMDISGVGEYVNYSGSYGNKKTYFSTTTATLNDDGFALIDGPQVFPTEGETQKATVDIELIPKSGSILEGNEMKISFSERLVRNKKLVINLWFTTTYKYITIDVDTTEITEEKTGDKGIWE